MLVDIDEGQEIPHYTGNPRLRRVGVQVKYTAEQLIEIINCADDIHYFIAKYCKTIHVDHGVIPFVPYEYQVRMIDSMVDYNKSVIVAPRQHGKALSLDTLIATPDGWKRMGDIKQGDYVIGADGKPTLVTLVSETHFKDMYRVTFSDGSTVDACRDHLWTVYDRLNQKRVVKNSKRVSSDHRKLTISTLDMFNSNWRKKITRRGTEEKYQYAYYIPNCAPIEYNHKNLIIDPYMLGLWLGDGSSYDGSITAANEDMEFYRQYFNEYKFGNDRYRRSETTQTRTIYGLVTQLKQYNLYKNKHIPHDYLYGSVSQRISLLQGIMDTDGWIAKDGTCHIQLSTKNERLIEDIYQLICSLGLKVRRKFCYAPRGNSERLSFMVEREKFDVCKLPRKIIRQKETLTNSRQVHSRTIVNIEPIEKVESRCISVDNDDKLYLCTNSFIPTHNTLSTAATILWHLLFKSNYSIACLAHKESQAIEVLDRVKMMYQEIPLWMQHGVLIWNRKSIKLENGSKAQCAATTSGSIRGQTLNMVYCDEFAHIPPRIQAEFYTAVLPTISSGTTTKIILTSTPKGFELFYKTYTDATKKKNGYNPILVNWWEHPDHDQAWADEQLAALGEEKFRQEFGVEFLGSSATLIRADKIKSIVYDDPIQNDDHLKIFTPPQEGHSYAIAADCSDGVNRDYNSAVVIDITSLPYQVVAVYRNNILERMAYPDILYRLGKHYNEAFIVVENNNMGGEVANTLYYELEYENLFSSTKEIRGNNISEGPRTVVGVQTNKKTKRIGCANLKTLIENDQLMVVDWDIIQELARFVKYKESYRAEDGENDDLVMCLVMFAYITTQPMFKSITDTDLRQQLMLQKAQEIEANFMGFGIDDGTPQEESLVVDLVVDDFDRFMLS